MLGANQLYVDAKSFLIHVKWVLLQQGSYAKIATLVGFINSDFIKI